MKQLLISMMLIGLATTALQAQEKPTMVRVEVDGLSCPFCAYGLEKHFTDLDGVKDVVIDIKKGLLTFQVDDPAKINEALIRKTVKKAGFTPRSVVYEKEEKSDKTKG